MTTLPLDPDTADVLDLLSTAELADHDHAEDTLADLRDYTSRTGDGFLVRLAARVDHAVLEMQDRLHQGERP